MEKIQCPVCGREIVPETPYPHCCQAATNGPPAPAEVADWTIEHPSADVLGWARQTFDEAEFLAGLREVEQGDGHRFEDFIDEIERVAAGKR